MRKNIFLFNLILIMLITLNCNMAYAEPNESTEQNEEIENEPYKTLEELNALLREKETLLFELNLKLKTMQLTNSSEIRVAKKDIARIKTALNAKRRA